MPTISIEQALQVCHGFADIAVMFAIYVERQIALMDGKDSRTRIAFAGTLLLLLMC